MNALVTAQSYAVSDLEVMARAVAASKLFGIQTPEQALALCLVAQAEGRHPASAAADYHIINGRPSKKADAMLRDFLAAGGRVEWHKLDDSIADATFSHAAGGSVRIDWTLKRAADAGLTTPMWKKYPRQMLRSRTVSEGVRSVYPMATSGMYVPEEVQDFEPPRQAAETVRDVTPKTGADQASNVRTGRSVDTVLDAFIAAMKMNRTVEAVDAWASREANSIMEKLNKRDQDLMQQAYEAYRKLLQAAPDEDDKPTQASPLSGRALLLESALKDCTDAAQLERVWTRGGQVLDELDRSDPERRAELDALYGGLIVTLPAMENA